MMYSTPLTLSFIIPYFPLIPIAGIILWQNSFLMSLLFLEAGILSLVFTMSILQGGPATGEPFLCLILLVLGACEAGLGLSIMVTMMRSHGNELTSTLTMSKC